MRSVGDTAVKAQTEIAKHVAGLGYYPETRNSGAIDPAQAGDPVDPSVTDEMMKWVQAAPQIMPLIVQLVQAIRGSATPPAANGGDAGGTGGTGAVNGGGAPSK